MKLLILGGTLFLGRALADAALAAGHEVTLFNRGRHAAAYPGVETLIGDRDGGLGPLRRRRWDAAIDTSGYVPRIVGASAELLADAVERYVFVSTVSVYRDFSGPVDESSPVATMPDARVEAVNGATYGPLKILCERAVEGALPGRSLIVRPGIIVGPHDPTTRFSYWTDRLSRGGEVLAPGEPATPVQLIDARDLAEWVVRMAGDRTVGTLNATGPASPLTMAEMLEACRSASGGGRARLVWVAEDFLRERGVQPWNHLPLWMPESVETHRYFMRAGIARALATGLTFRPLAETARDTLAWQRDSAGQPRPEKLGVAMPDETLTPERERALLDAWHAR